MFNKKPQKKHANKKELNEIRFKLNDVAYEQTGFLEKDHEDEVVTQHDIIEQVDLFSAQKYFDIHLDKFGPYRLNYTRNGRHLLIGGRLGHVAAFDWQTKRLHCEMNVMEGVNDVQWLHIETMFAVAQRQWTYIYDNQGIELHCLKVLDRVTRLQFLPYHFLLASINATGYLTYVDISVGKKVAGYSTQHGRCEIMKQNPSNAIINLGHSSGVVTMWSPNVKEPLVKMLCHKSPIKSIGISHDGKYMATSALDNFLNIWDMRTYKQINSIRLKNTLSSIDISQKGLIAGSSKNNVEIFKDYLNSESVAQTYLTHSLKESVQNVQFCPYEDVLGIGHAHGLSSILVPGAGEPNFDALETNPYETKNQRKQWEVKALLEKIQPELINLDPMKLRQIDEKTLEEKMMEQNKLAFMKPRKIEFTPKMKKKGKSKSGRVEARKSAVKKVALREYVQEVISLKQNKEATNLTNESNDTQSSSYSALDRFKRKINS